MDDGRLLTAQNKENRICRWICQLDGFLPGRVNELEWATKKVKKAFGDHFTTHWVVVEWPNEHQDKPSIRLIVYLLGRMYLFFPYLLFCYAAWRFPRLIFSLCVTQSTIFVSGVIEFLPPSFSSWSDALLNCIGQNQTPNQVNLRRMWVSAAKGSFPTQTKRELPIRLPSH